MRSLRILRWVWLVLLIGGVVLPGASEQAKILTVCSSGCQFARIQEAIEAAEEGDMIQIETGTYQENLVVNRRIILSGTSSEKVLLKAAVEDKPAVLIKDAHGVILSGMNISGAEIDIQLERANANILNNKIIVGEVGIKVMGFG